MYIFNDAASFICIIKYAVFLIDVFNNVLLDVVNKTN